MNKNFEKALARIGEFHVNHRGYKYKINGVVKSSKYARYAFYIEFDSGHRTVISSPVIINGKVKDILSPSLFGVGIIGLAGCVKNRRSHSVWSGMIGRCYDKTSGAYKYYGKRGVAVCERWHRFDYFLEDIKLIPNYHLWLKNKDFSLDKDYIKKGNKVYCSDYCSFQPPYIQQSYQEKNNGKNKGVSGVRCITWSSSKRSWQVSIYKGGVRVKRFGRRNLKEAKQLLYDWLLSNYPEHPNIRFGLLKPPF